MSIVVYCNYLYVISMNFDMQGIFKLPETGNYNEHAHRVFHFNAKKVFADAISYARIQAVDWYLRKVRGETVVKKRGASSVYLTEEEYKAVMY